MNFTASNTALWHIIIQLGLLGLVMLLGNLLRRKIKPLRLSLLPTAVIGGFVALFLRHMGWFPFDKIFLESMTYHMTAIGFIALGLRAPARSERIHTKEAARDGVNSGAFIVSNYLIQGIIGISVMLLLSATFMPNLFTAAGLILPMGFGQGPGQAYNVGNTYETAYGFAGGASFGLAIATMGMLWASVGGFIYLNIILRKKKTAVNNDELLRIDRVQEPVADQGEIPLTEAVDKFTIQIALVLLVYLATYAVALGITRLFDVVPALAGLRQSIVPLIWGFNFLIGSSLALGFRGALAGLRRVKLMKRKYTNNYMLNRISGSAFDIMIFASICAIEVDDLRNLWIPFLLVTTVGGIITLLYIKSMARILYPHYYLEGMLAMYGMMTGTVSTGILLLREVDPAFRTPASNNLVVGSSMAIVLGFPMLLMVGLAPQSPGMLVTTLVICAVYAAMLNLFLLRSRLSPLFRKKRDTPDT
ncbi:MAG: sodium:glutamate symporter [Ruminococcaceae bacterium]|nr:sodium:glutamate symporter [Oscillospiraceae bacterium]